MIIGAWELILSACCVRVVMGLKIYMFYFLLVLSLSAFGSGFLESIEHRFLGYADTNSDAPLLNSPYMEEEKYIKTSHGGTTSRLEQILIGIIIIMKSTVSSMPIPPPFGLNLRYIGHVH